MEESEEEITNTKLCIACFSRVSNKACICNSCGSYQKFLSKQKLINAGDLSLGLVVAFISICTVAITLLFNFLPRNESQLEFDIVTNSKNKIYILARNEGDRATVIYDGWLTSIRENGGVFSRRIEIEEMELLKPKEYKLLTLAPIGGGADFYKSNEKTNYKCRVGLTYHKRNEKQPYESEEFYCEPSAKTKDLLDFMYKNKDKEINPKYLPGK